ncbi:GFA family protein [Achromobacter sp. UMC71]|uniref:GFA family protein n=1 Tax=Achromobacter sp. UMC71 TaxID=1862320 RepID=UPI0015FFDD2C|nr:GFA family protein [Achromobacter sp. UMC71]MBB1624185.1 aldehyde-activating protein [Achromobacter sp. UMC71]
MQQGSCHCGQITFEVEGEPSQVLECNCSHCSRKGYLLWFVPRGKLRITSSTDSLSTYKFNKHVISHHFCANCGCAPFGFGASPTGEATAAVNARCLVSVDLAGLTRMPYDGRSV